MHPVFFHIGNFEVSSFGVMVALGALAGLWLFKRELAARSVPASALDAAIAGLLGGMIGAKLLFVAEHAGQEPFLTLLLDRGGLSWFGGFAGGIGLGALTLMLRKLSILRALASVTPALAIGQMFGRFGCFLVGDDYGRPTSLPWGIAFPEGLPPTEARVHPTQLYEAAFLGLLTLLLLRWSRRGASDARIRGREVHQFGKGDDPSGWVRNDLDNTVRSCESCHTDGTLGAPIARHSWLPPLHLDRIACATCHIPRRYTKAALVQASDVFNAAPRITPPPKRIWAFYDQDMKFWNHYGELDLFTVKDQPVNEFRPTLIRYKGKIFPANRVHSSWVGFEEDGKPGLNQLFMKDFYSMWLQHKNDPSKYPQLARIRDDNGDGMIEVNRPEEIDALLAATRAYLAATGFPLEGRRLVYVSDDRKYSSAAMFEVLPHEPYEATPYASVYKYSHNVLPAKAALGAGGCKDCHAADSAFFFAPVVRYPFGPDGKPVYAAQHDIIGYDGSPREYGGVVAATQTFFRWLTVIVIGGMLIHIVLDIIARRRHAAAIPKESADQSILRFNSHFLAQHLLLMTSVILLLLSGLFAFGARYPGAGWASALTGFLGGLDFWRVVHRVGASILVFVCGYHAIYSLIHPEGRRDFVLLLPRRRDFREFGQNLMWMVGKRNQRPSFSRFAYFEKFDYWAVFWGCAIFVASGLCMWFPNIVRNLIPAASPALFDALKEAHAHEAVLALLAIAVWHVYNVHLRPGRFPGSLAFLHGRIGRKEMEVEHPMEFPGQPTL
jgi:thiosulfate reductase cytochrome b subunit